MPEVLFLPAQRRAQVAAGVSLLEAAQACGVDIHVPCGGQGRCGRCAVVVQDGDGRVRRRSTVRLSAADIAAGYALACQSLVLGDLTVVVPAQEEIARHLVTAKHAAAVEPPAGYTVADQPLQALFLALEPPSLADQTDDWSRLQRALAGGYGVTGLTADLSLLQRLGETLRAADWQVTAVVELDAWDRPSGPPRLVDLLPGRRTDALYAVAVDIGTTTVSLFLVDLMSGRVVARAADYNDQIRRGEDIISRIVYASRKAGNTPGAVNFANLHELQQLVVGTINRLIEQACRRAEVEPQQIYKATVAGNPTMLHLFLGLPPEQIRLTPYIPAVNHAPSLPGAAPALGLAIHPQATVDCLPGVASYVGADITAGVLSSGLHRSEALRLFIDIGTNGEMVLGNADWLICCACSAGPAFEGAGVEHGMRATAGAIEEVWVNGATGEPTYRTVGGLPPKGLCGSGLISLLAELFLAGVVDKRGHLATGWTGFGDRSSLGHPRSRVRQGEHGAEYVVAWAEETATGQDIVLTEVDIDNLLRTKAAIFAGFTSLAEAVGVPLDAVEEVLIGGAFGQHINVEKAVEIGLLPDLGMGEGWARFRFLGNTALSGAYLALVSRAMRQEVREIADKMTYLELSADNRFYEHFMSAMFLPHTDERLFPSVANARNA